MAEFPALPLWTDRYLADTRHLSTLEHGAYMLLLMEAWRRPRCALPDNDVLLARLAGLALHEWDMIKHTVMSFWQIDGRSKEWTQKTLTKERVYVARKSGSQRDKAVKRWKTTAKDDAAAMPEGMPEACPADAPTPTPTIEEKKPSVSKKRASRLPPEWAPSEADKDWLRGKWPGVTTAIYAGELEKFRNYWLAKSGKDATKLDWSRTWQNWMMTAQERAGSPQPGFRSTREPSAAELSLQLYEQMEQADERSAEAERNHPALGQHAITGPRSRDD